MASFRAVVHYNFKKGMEEQGIKFLETELLRKAKEFGCHGIELWQSGKSGDTVLGIGLWNSVEEARRFQAAWGPKEKELLRFCTGTPHREFYKVRSVYAESMRKAA
jgi:hypothetical protein